MNKLISAQAAIDAVKKNTFRLVFSEEQNCEGHVAWSADAVYSDVMEGALLELPSAQPEITLESAIDYLHSIGWMQKHDKEMTDSAYSEGHTAAESKYRKIWDEMQATQLDAVEDAWDMFQMISSAWYGKGCYSKQDDGSVYSRLSCKYMTFDDAVREFMEELKNG